MTDLGRAATGNDGGQSTSTGKAAGFFDARWRGEISLGLLIWRDMLLVGSALNAAASMAALWLVGMGAPPRGWFWSPSSDAAGDPDRSGR